jgi:hypothetical protein
VTESPGAQLSKPCQHLITVPCVLGASVVSVRQMSMCPSPQGSTVAPPGVAAILPSRAMHHQYTIPPPRQRTRRCTYNYATLPGRHAASTTMSPYWLLRSRPSGRHGSLRGVMTKCHHWGVISAAGAGATHSARHHLQSLLERLNQILWLAAAMTSHPVGINVVHSCIPVALPP